MAPGVSASLSVTGLFAPNKSIPLSAMVIPKAEHRFPGPRAKAWLRHRRSTSRPGDIVAVPDSRGTE
jgi:hypothetical protein